MDAICSKSSINKEYQAHINFISHSTQENGQELLRNSYWCMEKDLISFHHFFFIFFLAFLISSLFLFPLTPFFAPSSLAVHSYFPPLLYSLFPTNSFSIFFLCLTCSNCISSIGPSILFPLCPFICSSCMLCFLLSHNNTYWPPLDDRWHAQYQAS